jgi:hypothetical protein
MEIAALNSLVSLVNDVVDLILGEELPIPVEQVMGKYLVYCIH